MTTTEPDKFYTHELPKYTEAVNRFIAEKGHEPTSIDFDKTDYLPSSRTIQRKYGGLPQFCERIGLSTTDFSKGSDRSLKAKKSMDDCLEDESALFADLLQKYGGEKVSSPAKVFHNRGIVADFKLSIDGVYYMIDLFKPNSTHSFRGCINMKNRKYLQDIPHYYEVPIKFLYVCVNEEVMVPIKNEIPVMSLREFREKFLK